MASFDWNSVTIQEVKTIRDWIRRSMMEKCTEQDLIQSIATLESATVTVASVRAVWKAMKELNVEILKDTKARAAVKDKNRQGNQQQQKSDVHLEYLKFLDKFIMEGTGSCCSSFVHAPIPSRICLILRYPYPDPEGESVLLQRKGNKGN
ncbi:hypothetical protein LINPERPRIM_LOCUS12880 [Linum perenne]